MAFPTFVAFLILAILVKVAQSVELAAFKEKVKSAKAKTDEILASIFTKWQVKEYPNFLNSGAMTHTAWEVLKVCCV